MDDFNKKPTEEKPDKDEKNSGINDLLHGVQIFPKISPVAAAIIGLVGSLFLYQIVGGLLTLLIFGLDLKNAPVSGIRLMTMAGQILFILLPALVFAKYFYEDVTEIIRFKYPHWEEVLLFLLGIIILIPMFQFYLSIQNYFINILASNSHLVHSIKSLLDKVNDAVNNSYGDLLSAHSVFEGIFVILIVAVVPAICEETMFRGFIQRSFEFKLKPVWAALITAVFFGLYHLNPYEIIPLILLGFYFGFAAYKSDSIFVAYSLHFFNNFVAIIFYFMSGSNDVSSLSVGKNFDLKSSAMMLLGLIILFGFVIYLIKRYYSKRKNI